MGRAAMTTTTGRRSLFRPPRWFVALIPVFGVLLIAALWSAVLYQIAMEERDTRVGAKRDTQAYVAGFAQHVLRKLRESDRTLQLLKWEIEQGRGLHLGRMQELGLIPGERSLITVIDRSGAVIAASNPDAIGVNTADKDYFVTHLDRTSDSMDVSRPIAATAPGSTAVTLSRRLNAADGTFAGVVALSLDQAPFTDFYLESDLGAHGVLAIVGLDGYYRARRAGQAQGNPDVANLELLKHASKSCVGVYERTSPYDGVERLVAYRRLPDYPLIVAAAQSTDEALEGFRRHRSVYLASAVAGTGVILPFFAISTLLTLRLQRRTGQLKQHRRFLQAILDNLPLGISLRRHAADGKGKYLVWNDANEIMFGLAARDVLGRTIHDVAPPATARQVLAWDRDMAASPAVQDVFQTIKHRDGTEHIVHRLRTPIFNARDEVEYVVTVSKDITNERAAENELRLASKVFETTADGIVISDREDRVIMVNSAFTRLSGLTLEEIVHLPLRDSPFGPLDPVEMAARMDQLHRDGFVTAEVRRRHKDGHELQLWITATIVRGEGGSILNYVRVFTDISTLKDAQHKLEQLAHIDVLTGLPNRRSFGDRLERALQRARRSGLGVGLLFLDLDGFKLVNDMHGHATGDRLLKQAAAKLSRCVRATDSLCRLGGDEFTIIIEDANLPELAVLVARRILHAFKTPIVLDGESLLVGASIGIALFPHDCGDSAALISLADSAMYRAKNAGGSRYAFFESGKDDDDCRADRTPLVATTVP
jgi:diguanylate cyclase (GGDEF)-like protein/PAS domain S-box-containing protein